MFRAFAKVGMSDLGYIICLVKNPCNLRDGEIVE